MVSMKGKKTCSELKRRRCWGQWRSGILLMPVLNACIRRWSGGGLCHLASGLLYYRRCPSAGRRWVDSVWVILDSDGLPAKNDKKNEIKLNSAAESTSEATASAPGKRRFLQEMNQKKAARSGR